MAQFARPSSDIATNSWTPSTGTTLYGCIDEVTASDADYIGRNAVSYSEVGLSSISDPVSSTGHVVRYRLQRSRTGRTLTISVRLMQGTTEIASWQHVNPGAWALSEQTLSGAQADAITDYGALSLRFDITALQNTQVSGQVSWAELETPDAGAPTDDLTATGVSTGAAALGVPGISQAHGLGAGAMDTAAPDVGSPSVSQGHVLGVSDLSSAAPDLGSPAASEVALLSADALDAQAPMFGAPQIGQVHGFGADDIATASPSMGAPEIGQLHTIEIGNLDSGTPLFGTPTTQEAGGADELTASGVGAGTPETGAPGIGQAHTFSFDGLILGTPGLDSPGLTQIYVLATAGVYTGNPGGPAPGVGQTHIITVDGLGLGIPALGVPVLDGTAAPRPDKKRYWFSAGPLRTAPFRTAFIGGTT